MNEAHARPAQPVPAQAQVSLLVLLAGEGGAQADHAHVVQLCRSVGAPEPAPDARHHVVPLTGAKLVWELHTEFSSLIVIRDAAGREPFDGQALEAVPAAWLAQVHGTVLVAGDVAVVPSEDGALDEALANQVFGAGAYAASQVRGGKASVAADFRLQADGFSRFLVCDAASDDRVRGRLVQRLLDIETYRMAALMALPVAREASPEMGRLERALEAMSDRLAAPPHMARDRELLQRLSQLAGEVEGVNAKIAFRFAAAKAYSRIVSDRIERLREDRVEGRERLGAFIEQRLAPAMRTCEATAARHTALAARLERASQLLATRVDVAVEEQNARLLLSMDRRATLQLRLQETVEGLSAVAITYYGVGLVSILAKGFVEILEPFGLGAPNATIVSAVAAPVIFILVWMGVRRVRRRLYVEDDQGAPPR